MPIQFPTNTDLPALQLYIKKICEERGWSQDSPEEKFILFMEEIGELAKAIRQQKNLYNEHTKFNPLNLAEEFADVLSYLLDLANVFEVDLATAFKAKELINSKRNWD